MSRRGWALFAFMGVAWGVPYLLIRVAVEQVPPTGLVFLRTAIGALLLLPFAVRRGNLRLLAARWRPLLAYTVVEVTLPWWLLSTAEEHLSSSLTGLIVAAVPLIGVVLNRATGAAEVVDPRRLAGLALGLAGVVTLVGLQLGSVSAAALGAVLLVAVGYATGPIVLSRTMSDLPGAAVVTASLAITAVVYAPAAVVQWPGSIPAHAWESIIGLGTICTALAFVVFFALIREIGPTRATVITYVNPAVALALGVSVLGERLTLGMAIGFPLVIAGSVLATGGARPPVAAAPGAAAAAPDDAADLPAPPEPGTADRTGGTDENRLRGRVSVEK